jgi:hypothetical protein
MDYQKILKQIAKLEGPVGKDKVEYAPGKTVPYGAEDVFSGTDWKNLSNLELGNKVIELLSNKQKNLEEYYGTSYTSAPDSIQEALLDLDYNVKGSITSYNNLSDSLKKGNYVDALKETLDVVSASDKKNQSGVSSGLVMRRALKFNEAIQNSRGQLESPLIREVKLITKKDNTTDVKYIFDDGTEEIKNISKPIHSKTKTKTLFPKEEQLKLEQSPLPEYANILQTELKEKPPIPKEESTKSIIAKRRAGIY